MFDFIKELDSLLYKDFDDINKIFYSLDKYEQNLITDEDFENEITKMAGMYGMEVDKIKEMIGDEEKKAICEDIAIEKAVNFVTDAAVEE